jgi:2-polyprenyl-6-methoxyphenol hydroxylase-like FAD-dependent oxidoreductase
MKIAISGAGVAGPTLAYWLHRTGHEPTLIERAPHFRTGGYVIDFWGVGYRVAQRMGLEAAIRDAGYQMQSLRSVGPDGQIQASLSADGLHSNVRRLTFGPESDTEHYLGCLVAAAVVEGYRPSDELVYVTYSRPSRSLARFSLRDDHTLFLFVFRSDQGHDPGELDTRKALLWNEFGDAGWECKQILAALDDAEDLYFDVVSQIRMDHWSQGRVALIGDAAACVSLLAGEGTGLAMTAAYVLAGELQSAQGDHQRAFEAYERRMRPFVEGKQAGAEKLIPVFATKTELGIRFRHLVMRAMNFRPLGDLLVSRSLRDDIELPDYPM